jgi:osmotically-inducible protein OsmY
MSEYNEQSRTSPSADWSTMGRSASSPGEEFPDERIRQDVCDRLMQLGPADCTKIGVTVEGGTVILEGMVATDHAVQQAETVVRSVAGVQSVDNRLQTRAD